MNEFNEQFDPNQFDWGSDDGIVLGDDHDTVVEAAFAAALAVHEQGFGWTYLRQSELRECARKLYHVKVVMPEEHRSWFEKEWPEYVFLWDKATQHHDHPRSHLVTELNEMEVVNELISHDMPYVDLYGNPGRNAKYKRPCLTLYDFKSPRDYIRYQHAKNFPRAARLDWERLVRGGYSVGKRRVHNVVGTHCLYYLGLEAVGQFVNAHPENRMHFTVHRHPESSGTLNAGELAYAVSSEGHVIQKNVLTGESYEHPSVEALFHQFNCKTKAGGLAWTTRKLGGDTFLIQFVGCPSEICEDYVPFKYLETPVEEVINEVKVRRFLHFTWTTYRTDGGPVYLEDAGLLHKLRRYAAGRVRNPRTKTELFNYAKRLVNKEDIISIHGGGAHEIQVAVLSDYVEAAFYMDVRHEVEVAITHYKKNQELVAALNAYMEKGEMPTSFVKTMKVVHSVTSGTAKAALLSVSALDATGHAVARTVKRHCSTAMANPWNPLDGSVCVF
jgi:hypothetical protein